MKVPFLSFDFTNSTIKPEITALFSKFFDKGWYILGDSLSEFEKQYAKFNNTQYSLGVSNGLDALFLSLKSLGIGNGDEVIVPSNTYIASVLSIISAGALPIFVEPYLNTYNINVDKIEDAISINTKAIMPVHLYGQISNMTAIMDLAKKYNLYVVEDNAQSHGSTWNGKMAGSWGNINATSFYPGKNLGAFGDAGGITTDNLELYNKVKFLRNYGSNKKYYNDVIGYNMRMDELQAVFLQVKLKYLSEWTILRNQIASQYNILLNGVGDLVLPYVDDKASHSYHLYIVRTKFRKELVEFLNNKGISTLIHYPVPPHLQNALAYLKFKKGDFPIAEEIADTCISLPLFPGMKSGELNYVVNSIKYFFENIKSI
jgi:dTDP-4-amino-4,6-dideoxygalactose transaminase